MAMKKELEIAPVAGLEQQVPTEPEIYASYVDYRDEVRSETELVTELSSFQYGDPLAGEQNQMRMTLARLRTEAKRGHYEDLLRRKDAAWRSRYERLTLAFTVAVALATCAQAYTAWSAEQRVVTAEIRGKSHAP
jgi:hypothetical protein